MTIKVYEENGATVIAPEGKNKNGMILKNVNNKIMEILNITGFADYLDIR